ncbi:MAG: tRNA (guanosine(46)-N7)-methyltransferase TrmB [Silvanigrellaceae bacterium]|nr:tRNA (guanosine(46)-N7)-methyltransferase TrmB [Silvanigrellaceae bacterium]
MKNDGVIIDMLKKGIGAPTRHENPYFQEALKYSDCLFTSSEIGEKSSHILAQEQELIVEIGSYQGKTLIELAENNPQFLFLGLDITYKRVVKTARKIHNRSLANAFVAMSYAEYLFESAFPQNSLRGVCVFFPDPWSKARHEKYRLLKENFIKNVHKSLKPGGFFWFKTDQENYFNETKQKALQNGFFVSQEEQEKKPSCITGGPYETIFQKIFVAKQLPFYEECFIKS